MQTACGACSLVQQVTVTASEVAYLQMTLISTTLSLGIFKLPLTWAVCHLFPILDHKSNLQVSVPDSAKTYSPAIQNLKIIN